MTTSPPRRLEDYALLGDNNTAALVHRDGSVDWLCVPRFDSPAVFAALVGTVDNGRWLISSAETPLEHTRRYRGDTLILETDITTSSGKVRVIDFMVPGDPRHPSLVRIVLGLEGRVEMTTDIRFRFNYGEVAPWVRNLDDTMVATSGSDCLALRTPVAFHHQGYDTVARFEVATGDRIPFVLTWCPSNESPPPTLDPEAALADTEAHWTTWSSQLTYTGTYRNAVIRSLLTLKALSYEPTGGIIAAPTTSLPEQVGARNWDYRFSWLRDASITLGALRHCGYVAEAESWRLWLLRATAGDPTKVQIMYGICGERLIPETELDWLAGYAGSPPVRIGNAAARQMQLDVYGEVIMALELARESGLDPDEEAWDLQCSLLSAVEQLWREPDNGLWEIRGAPRHFVNSKILAWVAVDRMIGAVERHGHPGPVDSWRSLRSQIRADILEHGYDPARNTFVQAYGGTEVDASLLVIPLIGFLSVDDPRVQGTITAIENDLLDDHGLVRRYRTDDSGRSVDGLAGREGAFLACSFWLADTYVLAGRRAEATLLFERLLELGSDLGLFAEEYDATNNVLVGNFPQAFTHGSVIHTALLISEGVAPEMSMGRWLGQSARNQSTSTGQRAAAAIIAYK
jgi:GH15 family glucan-1,4-alpha-glucosidase